jgi:hypothetical protein
MATVGLASWQKKPSPMQRSLMILLPHDWGWLPIFYSDVLFFDHPAFEAAWDRHRQVHIYQWDKSP